MHFATLLLQLGDIDIMPAVVDTITALPLSPFAILTHYRNNLWLPIGPLITRHKLEIETASVITQDSEERGKSYIFVRIIGSALGSLQESAHGEMTDLDYSSCDYLKLRRQVILTKTDICMYSIEITFAILVCGLLIAQKHVKQIS